MTRTTGVPSGSAPSNSAVGSPAHSDTTSVPGAQHRGQLGQHRRDVLRLDRDHDQLGVRRRPRPSRPRPPRAGSVSSAARSGCRSVNTSSAARRAGGQQSGQQRLADLARAEHRDPRHGGDGSRGAKASCRAWQISRPVAVEHGRVLVEPAAGDRGRPADSRRSQPGAGWARSSAVSCTVGAQPRFAAEVEHGRRQDVPGQQREQHARSARRAAGPSRAPPAGPAPPRANATVAGSQRSSQHRATPGDLVDRGRVQRVRPPARPAAPGAASTPAARAGSRPAVTVAVSISRSSCRSRTATTDAVRPARSSSVCSSHRAGVGGAQEVGGHRQRVGRRAAVPRRPAGPGRRGPAGPAAARRAPSARSSSPVPSRASNRPSPSGSTRRAARNGGLTGAGPAAVGCRCRRANSRASCSAPARSSRVRQRRVLTSTTTRPAEPGVASRSQTWAHGWPPAAGHQVLVARAAAAVGQVHVGQPVAHPLQHGQRVGTGGRGVRQVQRVVRVADGGGVVAGAVRHRAQRPAAHREHVLHGQRDPRGLVRPGRSRRRTRRRSALPAERRVHHDHRRPERGRRRPPSGGPGRPGRRPRPVGSRPGRARARPAPAAPCRSASRATAATSWLIGSVQTISSTPS